MNLESRSQNMIYDVEIGGYSLKLKTDQKQDKVEEIVKIVEDAFSSLSQNSNLSTQKALILSCLTIAENYYALKQATQKELDNIELRISAIESLVKSLNA